MRVAFSSAMVAACLVVGCDASRDKAYIEAGQEAVARQLIDPSSPMFSEVTTDGVSVCGYVNAKNRFGAYAGPRRFYWVEGVEATLEPDPADRPRLRPGVVDMGSCLFDLNYRQCKGEGGLPSIDSCMGQLGGSRTGSSSGR